MKRGSEDTMDWLGQCRFELKRQQFRLDVEFNIPVRGITGIFGASGGGKTMLLRCIAGLEREAPWESGDLWRSLVDGEAPLRSPFYLNNQRSGASIPCHHCAEPFGLQRAILTDRWKLLTDEAYDEHGDPDPATRRRFLFRIDRDPEERIDLSDERPLTTLLLSTALDWLEAWTFRGHPVDPGA